MANPQFDHPVVNSPYAIPTRYWEPDQSGQPTQKINGIRRRAEFISPGHLPNNMTVERILAGVSSIRNPILVSYIAKGILPYKGLGTGIKRALEEWPDITFADDRDGCVFTATVRRKPGSSEGSQTGSPISSPKTEDKIAERIRTEPTVSAEELGTALGISKRAVLKQIDKLKKQGRLRRIGSAKGGHWIVTKG